jgi:23S rRNA pseudouridine1911/1915/1917 synthase
LFVVDAPDRLDRFLAARLPEHSRSKLARLIQEGLARVDGLPRRPGFGLRPGMVVAVEEVPQTAPHRLEPVSIPLDVRYEDEDLLVVNKPRGLASHPAPSQRSWTLVNALLARGHGLSGTAGAYRPGIVHRLDRETTGLMVVAKTDAVHRRLAEQIQTKRALRRYVCVLRGLPAQERFTVDAPIGIDPAHRKRRAVRPDGKPAVTHFRRLARLDAGTLLGASLETGRTHQIRVHAAAIGHPVLGDRVYGPDAGIETPVQLHAAYLAFEHPATGEAMSFFAEPPGDFLGCGHVGLSSVEPW